ncbi:putative ubiquitin-specific processing protease 21 [Gigaspora margarita]|nr:putative ubiquitin-specific processing protease 21 [Gigaspora margarita]
MPDLGYEIEDFQYYTWRITGWSGLEKRLTSPEFEAGGWKWRILLFPSGNLNTENVSIYLDFADPKGAPAGWHSCVQFALLLWNPEDPTSHISLNAHHRFTAKEQDWGFTQFCALHKLFFPSENRARPLLIENNACNITAFVRIIKDPTGVLWHDFTNKEIKANERHLYLSIKIVTPDRFARHQWFDLANFKDRLYPSDVPQFMVLKSETYENFKDFVAKHFGCPVEQIRFWVFVNRKNKTVRPNAPIIDNFLGMTMEEIQTRMVPRHSELKLFLEVAKPINGKVWFPRVENDSPYILIFIKYFNPDTQSLEGLCHLYIQKFDKVGNIIPILCEKKDFPPHTPLKIYEEIKPNMIEEMNPNVTFRKSEIQNGDIICFQKALTEEEVQEHTTADRICDILAFYESLTLRIVVQFKPIYKEREPNPEFELVLNKKYTYDNIAKHVAAHLSTDPFKLQFITVNPTTDELTVIKRTTTQTLSEMIQTSYLRNLLYYETVNINNMEL